MKPGPTALQDALADLESLRRLTGALASQYADGDDALQHAMMQEARGKRGAGVPRLPWMVRVVRNHLRGAAAKTRRLREVEGVAARPAELPAAADLVQREELRRAVADAVARLAEPGQTTVRLRWFEGLSAADIAARTGVPVETVRTRLKRAHAALRRSLDRSYGDRGVWALLASPLLRSPADAATVQMMDSTSVSSTAARAASGATTPAALSVLLMKKSLLVAVCVLAAGAWVAITWLPKDAETSPSQSSAAIGKAPIVPRPHPPPPREVVDLAQDPATDPVALSQPRVRLSMADGTAAAAIPIWLWTKQQPDWTRPIPKRALLDGSVVRVTEPKDRVPEPHGATDAEGWIDHLSREHVAVSALVAPGVHVTWPLIKRESEDSGDQLCNVPALGVIQLRIIDTPREAPHDLDWHAQAYPMVSPRPGVWKSRSTVSVQLDDGPVIRVSARGRTLPLSESVVRWMLPVGLPFAVAGIGRGFTMEVPPSPTRVPQDVDASFLELLHLIDVEVVDAGGAVARREGRVFLSNAMADGRITWWAGQDITDGHGRIQAFPVTKPATLLLDVVLDNGVWFRRNLGGTLEAHRTLQRVRPQDLQLPIVLELPGFVPANYDTLTIVRATGSERGPEVLGGAASGGGGESPTLMLMAGELRLPSELRPFETAWVTTRLGRVGRIDAAATGRTHAGYWLPGRALEQVEPPHLLKKHAAGSGTVHLQFERPTSQGGQWQDLRRYSSREDEQDLVWTGLQVPRDLPHRLLVISAEGQTQFEVPIPWQRQTGNR